MFVCVEDGFNEGVFGVFAVATYAEHLAVYAIFVLVELTLKLVGLARVHRIGTLWGIGF